MRQFSMGLAPAAWLLIVLAAASCLDFTFSRGQKTPSPDGKTYLAVMSDNGGCEPMLVDGEVWPHGIGERGEIEPGEHTIDCHGSYVFTVPEGVLFEFDYWGP